MRQSHRQRASLPAAMSAGSWYRVHLADSDPMCFEKQGLSRFDAPQGEFKTYYVGCSPAAAFLEALGGIRPLPEHLVNERVITELSPGSSVLNVADFTDRRVLAEFDVRFDRYVGDYVRGGLDRPNLPYKFTQRLAAEVWHSGFQGIQYFTGHQPRPGEVSIAWFIGGAFDDLDIKAGESEPMGDAFLSEMRRRFDIEVFPTEPLRW